MDDSQLFDHNNPLLQADDPMSEVVNDDDEADDEEEA